jgi:hypothetical protein
MWLVSFPDLRLANFDLMKKLRLSILSHGGMTE